MKRPRASDLPLVLVDEEESVLCASAALLRGEGFRSIETLSDPRGLLPLLKERGAALILLDLYLPPATGTDLLTEVVRGHPDVPVIVMTSAQDLETAVDCMRRGAFDYLVKPVEESRFISAVRRALELRTLHRELGVLKRHLLSSELEHPEAFSELVTASRRMHALFQYAETVAPSPEPVLITGETGVGKELLAEAVHRLSGRNGRFVALNAAGLDDNLFSDTLFGHLRGAFTGAAQGREGLVAQAAGGTLFLDEIGDLETTSQVKLLRLVQEQAYYPLGSDVQRQSDIRVVCATHRDLAGRMSGGSFRDDLFYRLSVHQIRVPSLRERRDDIPLLVVHFIEQAAGALGKEPPRPPDELCTLLSAYHFPGNVRELRSMVMDAVAAHRSGPILSMDRFKDAIGGRSVASGTEGGAGCERPLRLSGGFPTLKQAETQLVTEALARAGGNQGIAAALLGISRTALNRRLSRLRTED